MPTPRLLSLLLLAWVCPSLAAAMSAVGLPAIAAIPIAVGVGAACVRPLASRLPEPAFGGRRTSLWYIGTWAILMSLAVVASARLSLFMADPSRVSSSVLPESAFYTVHSCLTALTLPFDLLGRGESIYSMPEPGVLVGGPFEPDPYLYPPSSLVVPWGLGAAALPFLTFRAEMFAVQAMAMLMGMVALGVYVGGRLGGRLLWAAPVVWLAPAFLLTMQIQNLHVLVFALSIAGMTAIATGRRQIGASVLAIAISAKLFPVVLVFYLAGRRRWADIRAVGLWCAGLAAASVLLWGVRPYADYLEVLPAVMSGTAPASTAVWIDDVWLSPSNHSVLGALRKLVALGVPHLSPWRQQVLQSAYGAGVFLLALACGCFRPAEAGTEPGRWREAALWLALLNLASFRSPFLPDGYAYIGTFWLLALVAARASATWHAVALSVSWFALSPIFGGRALAPQPFKLFVLMSLVTQVGVVAANLLGAVGPIEAWRRTPGPATRGSVS